MNMNIFKVIIEKLNLKKIWGDIMATPRSAKAVFMLLIVFCSVFFFFVGCTSASQAYIELNQKNADLFFPKLEKYFQEDQQLDDFSKELRIESLREWHQTINAAAKKGE